MVFSTYRFNTGEGTREKTAVGIGVAQNDLHGKNDIFIKVIEKFNHTRRKDVDDYNFIMNSMEKRLVPTSRIFFLRCNVSSNIQSSPRLVYPWGYGGSRGTHPRWRSKEEIFPPSRTFTRSKGRHIHSFPQERITKDKLRENGRLGRYFNSLEIKGACIIPRENTINNFTIPRKTPKKRLILMRGLDL